MTKSSFDQNKQKKDRMIMVTATAIVLVAFTLAGVYIRQSSQAEEFDGYVVDLGELNDDTKDKADEIGLSAQGSDENDGIPEGFESVGSENIEIEGLNEQVEEAPWVAPIESSVGGSINTEVEYTVENLMDVPQEEILEQEAGIAVEYYPALEYDTSQGLMWPVTGEILINYSVDTTVYFQTLDQYKTSDAIVIAATEATPVYAAAKGKVIDAYTDAQTGNTIVMELGNGYQATYGQLNNVTVAVGEFVEAGVQFATIAAPSKYYTLEGSNLYFKLVQDNISTNPLTLLMEDE